ncbi:MAG: hypothetical protein RI958_1072, partial [Actinomycetota bacterium]
MTLDPYRLPRSIAPDRYRLVLEPDLAGASFRGSVGIDLTVHDDADELLLNAAELEILRVTLDGRSVPYTLDPSTERLVVAAPVTVGTAVLEIEFTGTLNDKLRGWYRSTFRDADGTEQVIATSQMQTTDCR